MKIKSLRCLTGNHHILTIKSGDNKVHKNYRPVSTLSLLSKILERLLYNQTVLDTVHVTNFAQSRHCRWRTDSFTFVLVVSSIFFDFRRLSSDLRLYFLETFE